MNRKHSGLGISSFVISLLACLIMMSLFVAATLAHIADPNDTKGESTGVALIGLGIIGDLMMLFLALLLGVAGLFQQDRNKMFAIMGALISGLAALGTASLIVIALTMA